MEDADLATRSLSPVPGGLIRSIRTTGRVQLTSISLALVAIASGCRSPDADSQPRAIDSAATVARPDSAKPWIVRPTRDDLTCSPQTVGRDDVLVLRMKTPHGASLHVGAPDGTTYLVIFHGEGSPDRASRRSLMRPESFAGLAELRLAVGTLTGGAWVFGRDTNEVVFRVPGAYRIRVGNDMETDGPDYAECVVTYRPM